MKKTLYILAWILFLPVLLEHLARPYPGPIQPIFQFGLVAFYLAMLGHVSLGPKRPRWFVPAFAASFLIFFVPRCIESLIATVPASIEFVSRHPSAMLEMGIFGVFVLAVGWIFSSSSNLCPTPPGASQEEEDSSRS